MGANATCNSEMSNLENFYQLRGEQPVDLARQMKVCDPCLLISFYRDLKNFRSVVFIFKALHMGSKQLGRGLFHTPLSEMISRRKAEIQQHLRIESRLAFSDKLKKGIWIQCYSLVNCP